MCKTIPADGTVYGCPTSYPQEIPSYHAQLNNPQYRWAIALTNCGYGAQHYAQHDLALTDQLLTSEQTADQ